ncbi:MAG: cytidylyltransferase domain-containing protein, partial [Gammaproteobacteria bacterium]
AAVGTLCEPIESVEALFDPSVVKVVCDGSGHALYFSRAPIPWHRDALAGREDAGLGAALTANRSALEDLSLPPAQYFRHMGIYAYEVGFLGQVVRQSACELERVEALEQLRVLYHGGRIRVEVACEKPGPGIDTPADLERVRALVERLEH